MIFRRRTALLLMSLLICSSFPSVQADPPQHRFFQETGHTLADPMWSYWNAHGGTPAGAATLRPQGGVQQSSDAFPFFLAWGPDR